MSRKDIPERGTHVLATQMAAGYVPPSASLTPFIDKAVIDDYEAQVEDLTQRLNEAAADLLETRSQRAHLARQLAVAAEQAIEHAKRHAEIFDELVRERDQLRARNHALVAWYTSELERLRTIIGELGAAEAAEPPPGLEQVVDQQLTAEDYGRFFPERGDDGQPLGEESP